MHNWGILSTCMVYSPCMKDCCPTNTLPGLIRRCNVLIGNICWSWSDLSACLIILYSVKPGWSLTLLAGRKILVFVPCINGSGHWLIVTFPFALMYHYQIIYLEQYPELGTVWRSILCFCCWEKSKVITRALIYY